MEDSVDPRKLFLREKSKTQIAMWILMATIQYQFGHPRAWIRREVIKMLTYLPYTCFSSSISPFLWAPLPPVLSRSVMSDSSRSQGLQLARHRCPRRFSRQKYWSGLPCHLFCCPNRKLGIQTRLLPLPFCPTPVGCGSCGFYL